MAQELSALFAVLPPPYSISEKPHISTLIPFPLILAHASLPGLTGQPSRSVDMLFALLHACRLDAQNPDLKPEENKEEHSAAAFERIRLVCIRLIAFLQDDKV